MVAIGAGAHLTQQSSHDGMGPPHAPRAPSVRCLRGGFAVRFLICTSWADAVG